MFQFLLSVRLRQLPLIYISGALFDDIALSAALQLTGYSFMLTYHTLRTLTQTHPKRGYWSLGVTRTACTCKQFK